jgi:hypothetical protein
MRLAGILDARLHSLRHFHAAVLISAGYDIEAVPKRWVTQDDLDVKVMTWANPTSVW